MTLLNRLYRFTSNAFTHSFSYVIIFTIIYNLPIAINRYNTLSHFNSSSPLFTSITEFFIIATVFWAISALCTLNKHLFNFALILFFIAGGISDYFIFNFSKTFDIGVLLDILSNESALVADFINIELILAILFSVGLYFLASRLENRFKKSFLVFMLMLVISSSLQTFYYFKLENDTIFRSTIQNYLPTNIISAFEQYFRKYKFAKLDQHKKLDISKKYVFTLHNQKQPLNIILVIGESMRGDLLHINGYKKYNNTSYLEGINNLLSFKNASSTTSYTREALPLILTRSDKSNKNQALEQTSIISVFKKLGFETAWIGNQGLFADNDYSYGPIALEASYVISRSDIMREYPEHNHDSLLLNFLEHYLAKKPKANNFIVLHMMGSHWDFEKRYPKDFSKFTPTCNNAPQRCTSSELKNSYHNTILYSSYILSQITQRFKDKNAFLIFISDHGFSLFEDGFFGNAANPAPKEQLSIGMFAWGSKSFLASHLSHFNKLKAKTVSPVRHHNIFHTILGCVDVQSPAVDPTLNLCN